MTSVLVVEDNIKFLETYSEALREAGFDVDTASSRIEALEKVRCRMYDVALVDIMLKEDVTDRGGVDVVAAIHQYNEGTRMIVVSATDDIRVAIRTYQAGVVGFIQKSELKSPRAEIVSIVKSASQGIIHPFFGRFASINAFLAAPELTPYWETSAISTLECGYKPFFDTLEKVFLPYAPVLRPVNQTYSLREDKANKTLSGAFWSKAAGYAIWVMFSGKNSNINDSIDVQLGPNLIHRDKAGIKAGVWRLLGRHRDEFMESIWDKL